LTLRRSLGPLLDDSSSHRCHSLFRGGRSVILRDAADNCMDRQKDYFRANAALGRFFATLSGARAFSGTSNHPGAGKASGGISDGNRSFRRGCDYVYHRRSIEADIRRTAVSAQSREAAVDSRFRFRISILATNDGPGRIDGSLEGLTKAGRQSCIFASNSLASIQANASPSIPLVSQVKLHLQTRGESI
jgi:hypothetical protein